jgi:Tfp pilus assembly protein PilF
VTADNPSSLLSSTSLRMWSPQPKPVASGRPPAWLRAALRRGLQREPRRRYPSMDALLAEIDRPSQRRIAVVATVAVACARMAFGGALVRGIGGAPEARCQNAGDAVRAAWSPSAREAIERAFAHTGVSHAADTAQRVSALLAARAGTWTATRTEVCSATWIQGRQSEVLLDVRMQCLDRRLNQMRSFIALLSADVDRELVDRAIPAALTLDPVEECTRAQRFDESLRHYQRALELWERAHGPSHPNVASGLTNVGAVLNELGRAVEAEAVLRRALDIVEARLGPKHQNTGIALYNLGAALHAQGRYQEALAFHRRALDALQASAGEDHEFTAEPLVGVGKALIAQGDSHAALAPLERALRIYQTVDAPNLADAQFQLARALWAARADRGRARSLAQMARSTWAGQRQASARLEEVDAWLAGTREP